MTFKLPFPAPGPIGRRRPRFDGADLVVLVGVLGLLAALAWLSAGLVVPFGPGNEPAVSTDPAKLPYYAGRSLLRMFTALAVSTAFSLVYGYAAATERRPVSSDAESTRHRKARFGWPRHRGFVGSRTSGTTLRSTVAAPLVDGPRSLDALPVRTRRR